MTHKQYTKYRATPDFQSKGEFEIWSLAITCLFLTNQIGTLFQLLLLLLFFFFFSLFSQSVLPFLLFFLVLLSPFFHPPSRLQRFFRHTVPETRPALVNCTNWILSTMYAYCPIALFKNYTNVDIKNALVFLLVLRVIETFFYKACLVPGLLCLPHLNPFLAALTLLKP